MDITYCLRVYLIFSESQESWHTMLHAKCNTWWDYPQCLFMIMYGRLLCNNSMMVQGKLTDWCKLVADSSFSIAAIHAWNCELCEAKMYHAQQDHQPATANVQYNFLPHNSRQLYKKYARLHGIDISQGHWSATLMPGLIQNTLTLSLSNNCYSVRWLWDLSLGQPLVFPPKSYLGLGFSLYSYPHHLTTRLWDSGWQGAKGHNSGWHDS